MPASKIARLLADERVRFLIVGVLNTGVGYGLFVLFELLVGRFTSYYVSLVGSFVLATVFAFVVHRKYTFRVSGTRSIVLDFVRFQGVNVVALAVNALLLPVFVELLGFQSIVAQALIVFVTTIVSYLGHKFFSFRRKSDIPTQMPRA